MQFDKKYLNIALFHLEKIIGSSFPNPPVFAILVESNKSFTDNKIVSFGYTSPSADLMQNRMLLKTFSLKRIKYTHDIQH